MMTTRDFEALLGNEPVRGYEGVLGPRHGTLTKTLPLLDEIAPKVLVETGCQHTNLLEAHGASTLIFGTLAGKYGALLYTVDNDALRLEECRKLTASCGGHVRYVYSDSVAFLSRFGDAIDFLYLDSLDFHPGFEDQSRRHQLREIQAAYDNLRDGSLVLLDDASVQRWFSYPLDEMDREGKTYLSHRFLLERGAECLVDVPEYQRLYRIRKGSAGPPPGS